MLVSRGHYEFVAAIIASQRRGSVGGVSEAKRQALDDLTAAFAAAFASVPGSGRAFKVARFLEAARYGEF